MLRDILAAIARADYEAAAISAKLEVAPHPARGGAPLSPVAGNGGGAFFSCPLDPDFWRVAPTIATRELPPTSCRVRGSQPLGNLCDSIFAWRAAIARSFVCGPCATR
jgi:hypothetical protein